MCLGLNSPLLLFSLVPSVLGPSPLFCLLLNWVCLWLYFFHQFVGNYSELCPFRCYFVVYKGIFGFFPPTSKQPSTTSWVMWEPCCTQHIPVSPFLVFVLFISMCVVSVCSTLFFSFAETLDYHTYCCWQTHMSSWHWILLLEGHLWHSWSVVGEFFQLFSMSEKAFLLPLGLKDIFLV